MVAANGIDLALFQFEYNLTWAAVFLNADGTLYGRYGGLSRQDREAMASMAGFAKALEAVLELHRGYPGNKASLSGKKGPAPRFPTPEGYPDLRDFAKPIDTRSADKAETSCLHCHYIEKAEYKVHRAARQSIPDEKLWAYPAPGTVGLALDLEERATVKAVAADSPAEKAGFKPGDEIQKLEGQPIVSIADVQWVLHQAKDPATLKAEVRRGAAAQTLTLSLPAGWRRKGRGGVGHAAGTWVFRPISDAEELSEAERGKLGLPAPAIAILIKWPDYGLKKDDIIVEVDGRRSGLTLDEFLAYAAQKKMPGEKIQVAVLRGGKEERLQLTCR
jgi:membrane-associated protease RseP (regulator of RpoE activity)